jgi:flagella basal body P-ring formation protein FlgA
MRLSLFIAAATVAVHGQDACVAVDHGKILVADLRQRVPALKGIDSSEVFGFAPAPGQTRVVRPAEITRFLRRLGISESGVEQAFCVQRRTSPPSKKEIEGAVHRAFPDRKIDVDILQSSELPVPAGAVEFEASQLPVPNGADSVLWRGIHRDLEGRTRPFWARMSLKERVCRFVANEALNAAQPLSPDLLRREELWEFPSLQPPVGCDVDDLSKLITRRALGTGTVLRMSDVVRAPDVKQGEAIKVVLDTGKAQLSINGRAEAFGRIGERVAFTTSLSRRRYVGVVVGKGIVQAVTPTHE